MALRFPVEPMKATIGTLPAGADTDGTRDTDDPPGDEAWAYEVKWDGYRTLVHVADGTVRLQSASGRDVSARWPEIGALADAVNAPSAIIDGELVVLDGDGRPNFGLLQASGIGTPHQAVFYAFDVLQVDGTDTIDLSYLDRRRLLDPLLEAGDNWTTPSFRIGGGAELLAATAEQGLEGVIAKRVDSLYRPGTRTKEWRKVKNRVVVELPIGGFTAGTGNRSSTFGALLVGRYVDDEGSDDGRLAFAGGVGTGFSQATLESLLGRLRSVTVDECPFDPPPPRAMARMATWVEPVLWARIEIAEFTNDGVVRHASFLRLADERS